MYVLSTHRRWHGLVALLGGSALTPNELETGISGNLHDNDSSDDDLEQDSGMDSGSEEEPHELEEDPEGAAERYEKLYMLEQVVKGCNTSDEATNAARDIFHQSPGSEPEAEQDHAWNCCAKSFPLSVWFVRLHTISSGTISNSNPC